LYLSQNTLGALLYQRGINMTKRWTNFVACDFVNTITEADDGKNALPFFTLST